MKKLGNIDRREFISGVAVGAAGIAAMPLGKGLFASGMSDVYYPPSKTGMRGTYDGSFEVAHEVAWGGKRFERPKKAADKPYDLIIVGGGISGLSAAVMARRKLGNKARILVLDNHDDFGGHAKRNEFTVRGKKLIGYGGSQSIDTPSHYSPAAMHFMKSLTVNLDKFYRYYDESFYQRRTMGKGLYLNAEAFGTEQFYPRKNDGGYDNFFGWSTVKEKVELGRIIESLPFSDDDKAGLKKLYVLKQDWLSHMGLPEKKAYLQSHSYADALRENVGLSDALLAALGTQSLGLWGLGWDAVSGLEAYRMGFPATEALGLDKVFVENEYGDDPYIFHFPDGNASIARLCVAELVPRAVGKVDMDSIVNAVVHYDRLDMPENPCRIRLNSMAVEAKNTSDGVEVTYVRDGKVERVTGRSAIMACWNNILPHIMPEMQEEQKEALRWPEKVPLVYINVALDNWRAMSKAGVSSIMAPGNLVTRGELDFPVSMGGYVFSQSPDEPIVMHMLHVPTRRGLPARQQHREGRSDLLSLTFDDFEADIVAQLNGAFGAYGFDAAKDIAAITVNRWPHGYAYEYNELFDPHDWGPQKGPHIKGRETIGRIAIANADSSAYAYVNGALDAADRAVANLFS